MAGIKRKPTGRGRGHSRQLDREKIVDAALGLAREQGATALSMRRVAARLDVDVSALYWHFPNKAAMLAEVADAAAASVDLAVPTRGSWQERVLALCRAIRRQLRDRRELGLYDGGSSWATPFNALATGRLALLLQDAGLSERETIYAAQYLLHTVTAVTQSEVLGRSSAPQAVERFVDGVDRALPQALTGAWRELARLPVTKSFDEYFDFSIRATIAGISAEPTARRDPEASL